MKQSQSEALAAAEKNVRNHPTSAKFQNEKGDALYVLGRYSEALNCYDRALKIRHELEYLVNSGLCLIRLKEKDKAFDIFEEVAQADSKYLSSRADQFLKSLNRHEDVTIIYQMIEHIALKKDLDSTSFSISLKKVGEQQTTTQKIPLSQTIAQTVMAPPKPKVSPEQLILQDKLIAACKQGDEKAVKVLLQQGAQPDMANAKGEYPLGAAVWGMCPDVVDTLLKQAGGIAPMTWEECEKHNLKFYQEVFIIPKFDPRTFGEWNSLLQNMEPNPFIRAYHLKKADDYLKKSVSASWESLKQFTTSWEYFWHLSTFEKELEECCRSTESGYVSYRSQIKQGIESAKQPTVEKTF